MRGHTRDVPSSSRLVLVWQIKGLEERIAERPTPVDVGAPAPHCRSVGLVVPDPVLLGREDPFRNKRKDRRSTQRQVQGFARRHDRVAEHLRLQTLRTIAPQQLVLRVDGAARVVIVRCGHPVGLGRHQ